MPWHERACACRFARSCTVIIDQWRQDWCLPWEHLLPLLDMATWRLEYDVQRLRLWKGRRYYSEWLLLRPSCMSTGFDSWRRTDGFGNENSEWGGNWWCRWRWEQVLSRGIITNWELIVTDPIVLIALRHPGIECSLAHECLSMKTNYEKAKKGWCRSSKVLET